MNKRLIKEYLGRQGMVTKVDLIQQAGVAANLLWEPAVRLVEEKELIFCRLDHGQETLLSRHLFLCLHAVRLAPELSPFAQQLYDWLYDNETASTSELKQFAKKQPGQNFLDALRELESQARIMPIGMAGFRGPVPDISKKNIDEVYELSWVTEEYWVQGVAQSARYRDLEYDMSEVRKLMRGHFSTREIDEIFYPAASRI